MTNLIDSLLQDSESPAAVVAESPEISRSLASDSFVVQRST